MSLGSVQRKLLAGSALLVAALVIGVLFFIFERPICEARDGKWASSSSSCITRACYASGTCGTWAHPAERCDRLPIGASRSEVYFQLGEPVRADSESATWPADKASNAEINARFKEGHLILFDCSV